jgi:hypothetical protein
LITTIDLSSTSFPVWANPGIYTTASAYFAPYVGTYTLNNDLGAGSRVFIGAGVSMNIPMNTLTISVIPEPSTYAAIGGIVVLGLAVWKRYRRPVS